MLPYICLSSWRFFWHFRFIHYCRENKAYVGVEFEDEEIIVDDIIERFCALGLSDLQRKGILTTTSRVWRYQRGNQNL
jgi:hypothetical protein